MSDVRPLLFALEVALADALHCSYTAHMSTLHFEWDDRKAAANAKKHGVSFEEAKSFSSMNASS